MKSYVRIFFVAATITSGGGFSNVSSTPRYQEEYVRSYLNSGVPLPTGLFDPTKRAYPDVAVNGHNYIAIYSSIAIVDRYVVNMNGYRDLIVIKLIFIVLIVRKLQRRYLQR